MVMGIALRSLHTGFKRLLHLKGPGIEKKVMIAFLNYL